MRTEDPVQPAITAGGVGAAVSANTTAAAAGNIGGADDGDMTLVPGSETGQVEEASEYRFFLHRHWSLYDAMFHSPYIASKLRAWNQQGTATFQVILVITSHYLSSYLLFIVYCLLFNRHCARLYAIEILICEFAKYYFYF